MWVLWVLWVLALTVGCVYLRLRIRNVKWIVLFTLFHTLDARMLCNMRRYLFTKTAYATLWPGDSNWVG